MKFRSTKRRAISAVASTAVVAGALATTALLAAPAQAAGPTGVAYECTGSFPVAYTTDVDFSAQWDKASGRAVLSADLGAFPNGAPIFVSQPDQAQSATLKVLVDGAATAVSLAGSTTANFQGGVPVQVPTLSEKVSAKSESLSVVVSDFTITLGASTFTCTAPSPAPAAVTVPITFPSGSDLNYVCTFAANKFAYMTDATVTAKKKSAGVAVSVALEAMPNTAPAMIVIPDAAHAAELTLTPAGGAAVTATGSRVATFTGGTPVAMPALTATVPSASSPLALTAGSLVLTVNVGTKITCDLNPDTDLTAVTVVDNCTPAQAKVGPATAAVKSASAKVTSGKAKVKAAQTKVTKTTKALKKAKKAKKGKKAKVKAATKKLTAAKKSVSSAKKGLATANANLAKANATLAAAKKAVAANC